MKKRMSLTVCAISLVALGIAALGTNKATESHSVKAAAALDSLAAQAQAPGWSRGQQNLAIDYNECVSRMPAALQAEGYRRDDQPGGDFAVGIKGVHTAVIICSPAPEAKMLVHVVVASNGGGGGLERQRLQAQMERPNSGRGSAMVWVQVGTGDCSGSDLTSSAGFTPDNKQAQEGRTAICWDGKQYNNTYGGNSGRAFCTYKNIEPGQCRGGSNLGVMYKAVRR